MFHQQLLTCDDSRTVHLWAYNSAHRDLELLSKAPNDNRHLQKVSYRNVSIVVVESQAHFQGSLVYYMRSIFYFHPDSLVCYLGQCSSILLTDKQRRLRMFLNIRMVYSMIPIRRHLHRHPGLCKSLADINLLRAVVCVDVQDAVIRK